MILEKLWGKFVNFCGTFMYAKLVFPEKNSRSTFSHLKIFYFEGCTPRNLSLMDLLLFTTLLSGFVLFLKLIGIPISVL